MSGELLDFLDNHFFHDVHEAVPDIGSVDDFVAEAINDFALFVHHVVVFEGALADLGVVLLDPFLGLADRAIEQRMLQFLPFFQAHPLHVFYNLVGPEQPHEIVFQRDKKMRRTGVALAGTTAPQLAVNAAGLVALGADDVQAAGVRHAGAKFDVGAAAGHVGGDGDTTSLAGARDDFGFLLMVLGVEDGVDDAFAFEHAREMLADLDRDGADEDGPAL